MAASVKKLLVAILLILLSPLLLPLFVVLSVVGIAMGVCHWLWMLWYCITHLGELYLICSRRRGWQAFLENNLIPVLPSKVKVIWIEMPNEKRRFIQAIAAGRSAYSVPILALVTLGGIKFASLNRLLINKKHLGRSSQGTRDSVRPIIESAVRDITAQYIRGTRIAHNGHHAS